MSRSRFDTLADRPFLESRLYGPWFEEDHPDAQRSHFHAHRFSEGDVRRLSLPHRPPSSGAVIRP